MTTPISGTDESVRTDSAADTLVARLTELDVGSEVIEKIMKDYGAKSVEDLAGLTEQDLVEAGLKRLEARSLIKKLATTAAPAAGVLSTVNPVASLDILPSVPDDASWLMALKVGGVLKFGKETVIGAVSAALAERVGLYDLPKVIVAAMEENAESLEEPVGAEFFDMQRILTERSYADVFAAIPGATGRFATEKRKGELLAKLNANLWPALIGFNDVLTGYLDTWQKQFANPGAMMSALASIVGGGGAMPPGMMSPPPTDTLRDSAEGVITSINRVFAGTGIIVSTALAYDAQQIRKALENPGLPAQVGAVNREQMLKKLGVAVSSDYPRLEQNVKRYTLGVIELPNVTAGQTELAYITALFQLGAAIPWGTLAGGIPSGRPTGIGGRNGRL